jgi:hypothetical protein
MNQTKSNILIGAAMVLLAAILKIVTYYSGASLSPIIAIALFCGAVISDKKLAFILPILSMFIADLLFEVFNIGIGFYGIEQLGNYACLLFVTLLGFAMKKINIINVVVYSLASTLIFYFLSNTNSFLFDTFHTYERSMNGYIKCMVAGLEFLRPRLFFTDLFYSGALFGSYVLLFKRTTTRAIA